MKLWKFFSIVLVCVIAAACSSDKGPAEEAIKAATAAVDSVRADGARFAADQFNALESGLKAAQDAFAKGDYKAALAAAKDLGTQAQEVAKTVADKKAELTKAWEEMSAGIPEMMDSIKSRLDILGQAKKLPAGLDKDKLTSLQAGFDEAMKQFEEAKAAAATDPMKAVELGTAIKSKGMEIAKELGLQPAG